MSQSWELAVVEESNSGSLVATLGSNQIWPTLFICPLLQSNLFLGTHRDPGPDPQQAKEKLRLCKYIYYNKLAILEY